MRAPGFWSDPQSLAGRLLSPLGAAVGALTLRRMAKPGLRAPLPVVCVGNPTVGGSGKTPATRMVMRRLADGGHRPAVLTRGYGGSLKGPVVVDAAGHSAAEAGDEALLHAASGLTVLAHDRPAGAALAAARGATIIVMDDGFQNPSLVKDLSILVVDGAAGLGNGRVLPAGPLRAPFAPQMASRPAAARSSARASPRTPPSPPGSPAATCLPSAASAGRRNLSRRWERQARAMPCCGRSRTITPIPTPMRGNCWTKRRAPALPW
ncbi:Tetraacyldisaccharide 4'-kinase [bacterium YEK0313]|nr:Tetraacyldisaccharide 4'-kinase [bacterium YEK0313]